MVFDKVVSSLLVYRSLSVDTSGRFSSVCGAIKTPEVLGLKMSPCVNLLLFIKAAQEVHNALRLCSTQRFAQLESSEKEAAKQ